MTCVLSALSSCCAAIRAMEMRKGSEALVVDPMAELLAGEAAMKRMEVRHVTHTHIHTHDTHTHAHKAHTHTQ